MNTLVFYKFYTLAWSCCIVAAILLLFRKRQFKKNIAAYLRFLLEPWKTITFIIAASGITLVAPYTGDYTWDYVDGVFISILTFTTAPWAVGAMYRSVLSRSPWPDMYIAICLMLFTSSWSYDVYIWFRDSVYPATWLSNLIISPCFYLVGGLFWNLEHHPEAGLKFSFQRNTWYHESTQTPFRKLIWIALPFMAFALYGVLLFVIKAL